MTELPGLGASAGRATGRAYRLAAPPALDPATPPPTGVEDEVRRAYAAIEAVRVDLTRRAETAAEPTTAEILHVQAALAGDRTLRVAVEAAIRAGHPAPHAIASVLAGHRGALEAAGGLLAARAPDLDDLRDRLVAHCLGRPMPTLPEPGHPYVLIATELSPADAAVLDPERVLAVVTSAGSYVSHTAILARAKGIPTVVACAGAVDIPDGAVVTVDGTSGVVSVGAPATGAPAPKTTGAACRRGTHGCTADGHRVALLANIGSAAELTPDVEGVGLFRTELLFQHHLDPPDAEEQAAAYAAVFAALPGRRVVVRTLDAGSDKPLPFLDAVSEPNPALGSRGLRAARRRPEVLHTQIAAIAAAARSTSAEVAVMAPMVTTTAEAASFATLCRAAGLPTVGAMVEVPAAAVRAADLLRVVDFLSIGTNDLSQYAFAADRGSGDLADLLDPWQPASLSLIAWCAAAGRAAGRPVGVCGEAAADPSLAPVLVGLGVSSLSMAPPALPAVRDSLAAHTLADCEAAAAGALAAVSPEEARVAARR